MIMFAQRHYRTQPSPAILLGAVVLGMLFVGPASSVQAQLNGGGFGIPEPGGQYPSQTYFDALQVYRDGDLDNAIRGFEMALRSTRTDVNGKWIDAIPGRVMLAECYWHLGHLPACRVHLDEASRIAVRNRGWLGQLDFSVLSRGGTVHSPKSNLWPEVAAIRRLPLPNKIPFQSGQTLTEQSLAAGGVIETPTIKNIDAIEIMRCLGVMSHRRRVLMGPLSGDDAVAREVIEATKLPAGMNHPVGQSLLHAMRGSEYFSILEDKTVFDRAAKYAIVDGSVHPLTPMLLLCGLKAGTAGNDDGNLSAESRGALVSTAQQIANSAAALEQYEFIGEALQVAAGVADPSQLPRVEQSAALAARTLVRESRLASLHNYLVAADAAISANRVDAANEHLQAAVSLASRRDVRWPRLQAYGAYVAARIAAHSGQPIGVGSSGAMADSLKAMSDFILNQRDRKRPVVSMPFLYQAERVLSSLGGNVGNQSIKRVLEGYAGDVGISLWRLDPLDAMAAVYFDDSPLHRALLNIASMENNGDEVLRQTDRVLAKQFTRHLPLQGRLLQFRTLASSPANTLWAPARTVLAEPPELLKRLRDQTQQSLLPPAAPPLADPADQGANAKPNITVRSQPEAFVSEAVISELALSRMAIPEINPPAIAPTDVALIPDGVALLTFAIDSGKIHATCSREGTTRTWVVPAAARMPAMVAKLLQDIGASRSRGKRLPDDQESWRSDALKIRSYLLPDSSGWTEKGLTKIIIVPDGALWYLPFDLLPAVGTKSNPREDQPQVDDKDASLWTDNIDIQLAPTPGFALRSVAASTSADRIALVTSGFFAVRDAALNQSMVDEVMAPADDAILLSPAQVPPTERLGLEIGHLIVAAPVTPKPSDLMSSQILPADSSAARTGKKTDGNRLMDWVRLPAGSPQSVVLAGLRTAASSNKIGDGSELFIPAAALHASGVREVMFSRWPTGGQSAATMLTEVVAELPHTSLAEAARRGVMMLRSSDLAVSREPLLGKADEEVTELTGDQPLFWATYFNTSSLQLPPPVSKK
ncbi:CHAT domain-containing protein [Neorhodopirellula lusitana]|uniref:CHAT domain-containing protein n=1 Tax=Neorhodopirellula lusitana TaxID=445327 RepID=UPI00384E0EE6